MSDGDVSAVEEDECGRERTEREHRRHPTDASASASGQPEGEARSLSTALVGAYCPIAPAAWTATITNTRPM
jgi:hypothetical protein